MNSHLVCPVCTKLINFGESVAAAQRGEMMHLSCWTSTHGKAINAQAGRPQNPLSLTERREA
jgi:hypothetical protein